MNRNWKLSVAGMVIAVGAIGAAAWQKPPADEPVYVVTDWPAASDSRPYREFLQDYLNEMAQKGLRLDQSLLSATNARMLVFRRE